MTESYAFIDSTQTFTLPITVSSTTDAIVVIGDALFSPSSALSLDVGVSVASESGGTPADPGSITLTRSLVAGSQYEYALNGVITGLAPGTYYVGIVVRSSSASIPLDHALLTAYLVPNAYPPVT